MATNSLGSLLSILMVVEWACEGGGAECNMQASGGRVWLERSRVLRQGVAASVVAMFCSPHAVTVQLWLGAGDAWTLDWQHQWLPRDTRDVQTLDLPREKQIRITPYHRVGLAMGGDSKPISIRKIFNETLQQLISSKGGSPYEFDTLPHPGTFTVDFCGDSEDCPQFNVPPVIPTTPSVECEVLDSGGKIKLEGKRKMSLGVAKAIKTRFCDVTSVNIQLWHELDATNNNFTLVWQKRVNPVIASGDEIIIPLRSSEYITILETYRLALQPTGANTRIPVPYRFSPGSPNLITSSSDDVTLCGETLFEGLPYPHEFLLDFCYDTGCRQQTSDPRTPTSQPCVHHIDVPTWTDGHDVPTDARRAETTAQGTSDAMTQFVSRQAYLVPWITVLYISK